MKNALLLCCLLFAHYADGQVSLKLQLNAAQPIGDINATPLTVNGGLLSVLYDLNSYFTVFGTGSFNSLKGKEPYPYSNSFGRLDEPYFESESIYIWCPTYASDMYTFSSGMLFNLNLMKDKLNLHLGPGVGLTHASSYIDLLDENNEHYTLDFQSVHEGSKISFLITGDEFDGVYETKITKLQPWLFSIHLTGGIDIRINKNLAISADYTWMLLNTDYLDGIQYRTAVDQTSGNDSIHYLSLGLKYSFSRDISY